MKNYSQTNEQEVILTYFGDFKGLFCDLGANDGITFSNTYSLALLGWKGTLVEPSPKAFRKLSNTYADLPKNFELLNAAIGDKAGKMILQESGSLVSKQDVALVSTFHESEMDRFRKVVIYTPIEVNVMAWSHVADVRMNETIHGRGHFDFISMDIEGSELEVLPQMDLSETKLICIEWNSKPDLKKEYEKYLSGFKLIHTTAENLIYGR